MATATYEPISTVTLGSAAASITFSSIAATWTDLRVVLSVTGNASVFYAVVQFNSDTANNYSITDVYGNGSSAASYRQTDVPYIALMAMNGATASIPAFATLDCFSYAGTTYKTCLSTNSADNNGSGAVERIVGLWRSSSAITSVKIYDAASRQMAAGTTATLYGIKAA